VSVFLSGDLLERVCVHLLHLGSGRVSLTFGENTTFFFFRFSKKQNASRKKRACEIIYTHTHTERNPREHTSIPKGTITTT
jgi:hypothetical protein